MHEVRNRAKKPKQLVPQEKNSWREALAGKDGLAAEHNWLCEQTCNKTLGLHKSTIEYVEVSQQDTCLQKGTIRCLHEGAARHLACRKAQLIVLMQLQQDASREHNTLQQGTS